MRKHTILFFCFLAVLDMGGGTASAQAFEDGKSVVAVGYGFGIFGQANDYTNSVLGPVYAKYEYGLSDNTGIGLNLAYVRSSAVFYYFSVPVKDEYSSFSGLLRINSHFATSNKIDLYVGVGIGYRTNKLDRTENGMHYSQDVSTFPVGFEATLGMRFLLTNNLGVYVEGGFAKSAVQVGLCGKF